MDQLGITKKKGGHDSKYFTTKSKGEIHDLKTELNSLNKDKVKEAVKKVIAAMTVGKDVSSLFTDVVKSMQTDNVELKKLVYLYIINYARSQPDKAILVVNTFRNDATTQGSPLIRALAIRTMGCIRVDRITEYLLEPLATALGDKDPYVKKTAALCVAKLYDIDPESVEDQGFIEELRKMISDSNPMVVANAVAALAEISESSGKDMFLMNKSMLTKLIAALNEASEWGQVFILDCLSKYEPDAKDAREIIERVSPRLKHANSAVAMSAVRVIMKYLNFLEDPAFETKLVTEKLPPPLITMLSEPKPEIQYVALRNINLIVQKRPDCLVGAVRHFFIKYNDPIYVKMEKLEIMIKLSTMENIDKVLLEFRQYAREVDVDFVRKSVLAIGRCAIKLDAAAERCIKVLLELIKTGINYVVQEAVIVIKDIFRKYPNRYENIISTLCENLESLNEPEAKAAMVWIIGEYASFIDNAPELLEDNFIDTFDEEPPVVQLQILTAVVKLFLKRPDDAKTMVTEVLNMATANSDNPDLRDRGYVYWRLLSTDSAAAQKVVLAEKPVINDDDFQLEASVLDNLIGQISTLASIYHKPPEYFIKDSKSVTLRNKDQHDDESSSGEEETSSEEDDEEYEEEEEGEENSASQSAPPVDEIPLDLFGFDMGDVTTSAPVVVEDPIICDATKGKGLQIRASYNVQNGTPMMNLTFENKTQNVLSQFAIKFNQNWLGVAPAGPLKPNPVQPNGSSTFSMPLALTQPPSAQQMVQIALKTQLGVIYFQDQIPAHIFFQPNGLVEGKVFLESWRGIPSEDERVLPVQGRRYNGPEDIRTRMEANNVFYITNRYVEAKGNISYYSMLCNNKRVFCEITSKDQNCSVVCKSEDTQAAAICVKGITTLLTT